MDFIKLYLEPKISKCSHLYFIHTKKLGCLKSGAEFDMNDILYELKNLHHFKDSLTFGVNAVLNSLVFSYVLETRLRCYTE